MKKQKIKYFGKCIKKISKSANILIDDKLLFNEKACRCEVGRITLDECSTLEVNGRVCFSVGSMLRVGKQATLKIGKNTYFNKNTTLYCDCYISIGNNCLFSQNCILRDSDIHTVLGSEKQKQIVIGDNVWVGTNCIILKGVTIGSGSVIAAGSVVTKSFPEKSLIGGNPAKLINENIEWRK